MTNRVNMKTKDSVFRMVFREKEKLLSLCNALNNWDYDNPDDLKVVALENSIYMYVRNERVLVLLDYVNLYDWQSDFIPNMFLRDLFYIAKELEPLLEEDYKYSTTLINIPTPKFIVLHNGEGKWPECGVLKMSDSFKVPSNAPALEMKAAMLNINPGYNQELMENCQTLMEYAQYVTAVRRYAKKSSIEEAVPKAVDDCIEKGILEDLLPRNRAEVVAMSIIEYNEGKEFKKLVDG